jgi:hypothetical protein
MFHNFAQVLKWYENLQRFFVTILTIEKISWSVFQTKILDFYKATPEPTKVNFFPYCRLLALTESYAVINTLA